MAVERIFLNNDRYQGINKSKDSTDKKLLFTVPNTLINQVSTLLGEVERDIPEVQADIELNSLEDAFIKIAEKDIQKEMEENKAFGEKGEKFLSEEDEERAFEDYKNY